MISKAAFRLIVTATVLRTGKSQEELAMEMGYGKNYISEVLTPTGKLTEKFVKAFNQHYQQDQENPKDAEPLMVRLLENQNRLMERQNDILQKQNVLVEDKLTGIESNLSALYQNQRVADAKQRTALEVLIELHLKKRPEKTVRALLNLWDTRSTDALK